MSGQITTRIRDKILTGGYAPGTALLQRLDRRGIRREQDPGARGAGAAACGGLIDIEAHRGFRAAAVRERSGRSLSDCD
jgi:DNA-binding GntR family transcriptional regulator